MHPATAPSMIARGWIEFFRLASWKEFFRLCGILAATSAKLASNRIGGSDNGGRKTP
jgi:hypothetical protein